MQLTGRNRRTEKLNVQERISKNKKGYENQWVWDGLKEDV